MCTASALYAISPSGVKSLIAGQKTETGFADGEGTDARFNIPFGVAVDGEGNVLVADTYNHALRKVTLRCSTVLTLAGNEEAGYTDGMGALARFDEPWGIVVDAQGTIFVADNENHCLRQVSPGDGAVSTLAGDAEAGRGFADGQGQTARFNWPMGLALDTSSHPIVADACNNCIRKLTTAEGRVTTMAGSAEADPAFADGPASAARFLHPSSVAVDCNNNILVADQGNRRIRMIACKGGRLTTVAGSAEMGKATAQAPPFNLLSLMDWRWTRADACWSWTAMWVRTRGGGLPGPSAAPGSQSATHGTRSSAHGLQQATRRH